MAKFFVVIVAAGRGNRFQGHSPKQFCSINGKIPIREVVQLFLSSKKVSGAICVIPQGFLDLYKDIFKNFANKKLLDSVFGGETRSQSVKLGLDAITKFHPDFVLIHDAARCFCDIKTVNRVIDSLENGNRAVVPSILSSDSIRFNGKNLDRSEVKLIQTPQGFDFKMIHELHKKYKNQEFSDDASLCDMENIKVTIVDGDINNKKITYKSDIPKETFKIGFGFDAHKLSENRELFLMGIKIEKHLGLEGHSDADVGIHSLVDAIFGAIGIGSIGDHFPSSDLKWKGSDSKVFLKYCKEELRKSNSEIVNIDTTIICESPNISQYSKLMKKSIALHLDIDESLINIKGKSTEGMGFTGRKEGISACSNVLIRKIIYN